MNLGLFGRTCKGAILYPRRARVNGPSRPWAHKSVWRWRWRCQGKDEAMRSVGRRAWGSLLEKRSRRPEIDAMRRAPAGGSCPSRGGSKPSGHNSAKRDRVPERLHFSLRAAHGSAPKPWIAPEGKHPQARRPGKARAGDGSGVREWIRPPGSGVEREIAPELPGRSSRRTSPRGKPPPSLFHPRRVLHSIQSMPAGFEAFSPLNLLPFGGEWPGGPPRRSPAKTRPSRNVTISLPTPPPGFILEKPR